MFRLSFLLCCWLNACNTSDCSALWGKCSLYASVTVTDCVLLIFSRQAGGQRPHSLVCFQMSPRILGLRYFLSVCQPALCYNFYATFLANKRLRCFHVFIRDSRSVTTCACQLASHWFSSQTSQFSYRDDVRPHIIRLNRITTKWIKQPP